MQVTTPLLFKLIPAVIHLGVLLRWFSPDNGNEVSLLWPKITVFLICIRDAQSLWNLKAYDVTLQISFKTDILRSDSTKRITLLVQGSHDS